MGLSWAEAQFKLLPTIAEDLICTCPPGFNQNWIGYNKLGPPKDVPIGVWCRKCNKPTRYSLRYVIEECEGCERLYVPEFSPETYPIKYYLCSNCDVKPLVRRKP